MFREYKSESGFFQKSITETTQSFTSAAETSPTQAGHLFLQVLKTDFRHDRRKSVFACWWHRSQTHFRGISFCGYAPFRRFFSPPPAEIFCKRRGWLYRYNRKLLRKGKRHFFKNPSGSQRSSQRETLFKGFGMLPDKHQQRSAETEKEMKRRKQEVGQARKRIQKVDIVFNFVGEINFLSATQPKRQGA